MENLNKKNALPWGAVSVVLGGIVVGAVAGVLLAPDSGKETRRKLTDWLKAKRLASRETLSERKEQVLSAIQAGKKAYQEKSAEKKELVNA
jgi:gas vesicle protein